MPIKYDAKLSALLASRQYAECFILCIARTRSCFNSFKELTHARLVKAFPFQSNTHPSTLSSWVRRFWTISYTNVSVNRLILAELTWMGHLVSLFTICFSHLINNVQLCHVQRHKYGYVDINGYT